MSPIQELKPITIAQGCVLRLFVDHSVPSTSPDHRWTETSYDGKPDSQVFQVPPHWHKYHDEIMVVTEGELDMTVNGVTKRVKAGPERILIPRRARHSIDCIAGVPSKLEERTVPTGEFKEWFFRDFLLNGNPPSFLHAMRAFWDGDVYPALPGGIALLDELWILVFGGFAKLVMPAKLPLEHVPWSEEEDAEKKK